MANLTQNITNAVNAFGASPSSLWNGGDFGTYKWGEGSEDLILTVFKILENSQPATMSNHIAAQMYRTISETLAPTEDLSSQELKDGSGYNYVFRSPTIEGEDRNLASWAAATEEISTWTCAAATTSTWSES